MGGGFKDFVSDAGEWMLGTKRNATTTKEFKQRPRAATSYDATLPGGGKIKVFAYEPEPIKLGETTESVSANDPWANLFDVGSSVIGMFGGKGGKMSGNYSSFGKMFGGGGSGGSGGGGGTWV